jgi:hypothetical protein
MTGLHIVEVEPGGRVGHRQEQGVGGRRPASGAVRGEHSFVRVIAVVTPCGFIHEAIGIRVGPIQSVAVLVDAVHRLIRSAWMDGRVGVIAVLTGRCAVAVLVLGYRTERLVRIVAVFCRWDAVIVDVGRRTTGGEAEEQAQGRRQEQAVELHDAPPEWWRK